MPTDAMSARPGRSNREKQVALADSLLGRSSNRRMNAERTVIGIAVPFELVADLQEARAGSGRHFARACRSYVVPGLGIRGRWDPPPAALGTLIRGRRTLLGDGLDELDSKPSRECDFHAGERSRCESVRYAPLTHQRSKARVARSLFEQGADRASAGGTIAEAITPRAISTETLRVGAIAGARPAYFPRISRAALIASARIHVERPRDSRFAADSRSARSSSVTRISTDPDLRSAFRFFRAAAT